MGSTLSKQAAQGTLVRLGQGIYSRSELVPPSWIDALVVAVKAPEAVFSGATALHLHGLLRWVPPAVFVSQERGAAPPTAPYVPVRVRWVDSDALKEDTKLSEFNDISVRTSNPGRAAAELLADRYAIGLAMCASVILELCGDKVLDIGEALKHAHRLRCATEMETLLGAACG
jgi:predicted transcriptional regulator of viral defense system